MIRIRRGLDLPIVGSPQQISDLTTIETRAVRSVAVLGCDYNGMKPSMAVAVGDKVKLGQPLFSDKSNPGVQHVSPAAGIVAAINRGARRVLQSVVIDVEGEEQEEFKSYSVSDLSSIPAADAQSNLVASGLWTALRTRPYSKVPALDSNPSSIFVTAIDTNPLALNPEIVIKESLSDFENGLAVLSRLTEGAVYVCAGSDSQLDLSMNRVSLQKFSGVHPAGNAGTHIHYLDPVNSQKTVWTVGYQDVIAIGQLFTTGKLNVERIVSLAGPQMETPKIVRTRQGANLEELTAGLLKADESRIISGSVFGGRKAVGPFSYLGRYHNQVSVLAEGRERPFLHYLQAGTSRFSVLPIYLSKLFKNKLFSFTTSANGSERAMVPVGSYEKVMPLDILPTQLLRALIVGDTETAQQLGCLELDEEDLALCTFVCPGKYEYGPILRDSLTKIEKEG